MSITVAQLITAGIAPTQARIFAEPLSAACALFAIDTPGRIGAFVAQCRVESRDFTSLEESLYYTTPERIRQVFPTRVTSMQQASLLVRNPQGLANYVYSGHNGNGDPMSGDGWRFIGRGLIQITGRANYAAAAAGTDRPYVEQPGLVAQPSGACLSAAWFWHSRGLSVLADTAQFDAITAKINGPAMLEADRRRQYSEEACGAFA